MDKTYQYDREFQSAILATLVREPQALPSFRDVIEPRYFEDPDHRTIASAITDYYGKFLVPPTWSALRASLLDRCSQLGHTPDRTEAVLGVLAAIEKADHIATDFVLDRVVRFGKRQALAVGLHKIIDLLQRDEGYDEARALLDRALSVGSARGEAVELFSGVNQLEDMMMKSAYTGERIPTGIPALDEALRGGVGGPQLGIIQAPPKTGKSTVLVNFGVAALAYLAMQHRASGVTDHPNRGVLHISFELYKEDILLMYLARLTQMTRDAITVQYPKLYELWPQVACGLYPNLLRIQHFKPWSMTVSDLRDYISRLRATEGWSPRVLIIDYADRMKLTLDDDTYRGYGRLYDELIGAGVDFRYNTWSATQSNRTGHRAEKSTASQTSDSWLKVANSDLWIPLSQTDTERAAGMMRFNVEFLRRGVDGFEIPIKVDYARATIQQVGGPVRT